MGPGSRHAVLRPIDRPFRTGTAVGLSDAQLLERFVLGHDGETVTKETDMTRGRPRCRENEAEDLAWSPGEEVGEVFEMLAVLHRIGAGVSLENAVEPMSVGRGDAPAQGGLFAALEEE